MQLIRYRVGAIRPISLVWVFCMSFVDESQGLFVSRRKTGERWSRHRDSECFVREESAFGRQVLVSLQYLFAYLGLFEIVDFCFVF